MVWKNGIGIKRRWNSVSTTADATPKIMVDQVVSPVAPASGDTSEAERIPTRRLQPTVDGNREFFCISLQR